MQTLTIENTPVQLLGRFQSERLAHEYADRIKAGTVVLGDHPQYWVVTAANAARLERAGYAILTRSDTFR